MKPLAAIPAAVVKNIRGALASDQLYREADLAIDYCEDVPRLTEAPAYVTSRRSGEGFVEVAELLLGANHGA